MKIETKRLVLRPFDHLITMISMSFFPSWKNGYQCAGQSVPVFPLKTNQALWRITDHMELEKMEYNLTVCKVPDISGIDLASGFYFIGKTDEELSLVCRTEDTPAETIERVDGWKGFRIRGTLDFSLIGILSKLSGILADQNIGIFAVSTYNTDYFLVKEEDFDRAVRVLVSEGYTMV